MQETNDKTLFSFELLSHPDRTLKQHLDSCYDIGCKLIDQKSIAENFATKDDIIQIFRQLVYFHDFGKATDFFQYKIIEATKQKNPSFAEKHRSYIENFYETKQNYVMKALEEDDRLTNHSVIGAYFQLASNQRADSIEDLILFKIIKKHHGNLTNFHFSSKGKEEFSLEEETLQRLEHQLDRISFELYQKLLPNGLSVTFEDWFPIRERFSDILYARAIARQLKREKTLRYFFFQHYLYSLLLSADKGDVKLDNKRVIQPTCVFPVTLVGEYKEKEFGKKQKKRIDIERESAYQAIEKNARVYGNKNFFSITLPTGMGKTFSAYNASILLQNLAVGKLRIVYCLPFTSIIDQNVQVLADIFEKTNQDENRISKNHHLSSSNSRFDKYEINDQEGEYLVDGWEHDFIVTTFVQLMEGIFSNKNKLLRKFHNLTASVIILDEVQNIPAKYYEAIEAIFQKMAEYFGTKFLFVTATQPMLMPNTEVIELTDPTLKKTRSYFEERNRIVLDKSLFSSGVNEDFNYWADIFKADIKAEPNKSFLFILNTVASSQLIFESLKSCQSEFCDVFYLSSSVLPCFRKEIIHRIKQSDRRKIVIATQVVEAGVDIDLDIVYRDFAPLDSINQSAGRCNRNGLRGKGVVKLFDTGKSKLIYDSTLRDITKGLLDKYPDLIDESEFYELNRTYFEEVKRRIQEDNEVSRKIITCAQELLLEDLVEAFQLIDNNYPVYNVFIPFEINDVAHLRNFKFPYDKSPKQVWNQYLELNAIENRFERKQEIKKLRPDLVQFIAKFPRNKYRPPEEKKDNFIIKDDSWKECYDLEAGFTGTPSDLAVFF